jgi:hypothetical protein
VKKVRTSTQWDEFHGQTCHHGGSCERIMANTGTGAPVKGTMGSGRQGLCSGWGAERRHCLARKGEFYRVDIHPVKTTAGLGQSGTPIA